MREPNKKYLNKVLADHYHEENQWVLVDFGDIVVHIMDRDSRDKYRLEDFWEGFATYPT